MRTIDLILWETVQCTSGHITDTVIVPKDLAEEAGFSQGERADYRDYEQLEQRERQIERRRRMIPPAPAREARPRRRAA